MIAEVVTFPLSADVDRNSAIALYRKTSAKWAENPDLIRKYYIFDEARHRGGVFIFGHHAMQPLGGTETISRR
jgi:hypothetical protein